MDECYIFDTREQKNQHIKRYFDKNNIKYKVQKLDVGDYQIEGNPKLSVDRKQNIDELAANLVDRNDRKRFYREVRRAFDSGTKLIILCEHGRGVKSLSDVLSWKSEYCYITGQMVVENALRVSRSYGIEFLFCSKRETPKKIIELLTRH